MEKKDNLSFEAAMKQLEETVDKLGAGNLPLEETVLLYERGQAISKYCTELLNAFDARLDAVDAASGEIKAVEP
ncbi:MAG TPA: exodeoxyribonuclease VII small subunit [Clostridia bacterium]|nr:exodeoxyribonuclease VII small subunit [Clostridia bacterium]